MYAKRPPRIIFDSGFSAQPTNVYCENVAEKEFFSCLSKLPSGHLQHNFYICWFIVCTTFLALPSVVRPRFQMTVSKLIKWLACLCFIAAINLCVCITGM